MCRTERRCVQLVPSRTRSAPIGLAVLGTGTRRHCLQAREASCPMDPWLHGCRSPMGFQPSADSQCVAIDAQRVTEEGVGLRVARFDALDLAPVRSIAFEHVDCAAASVVADRAYEEFIVGQRNRRPEIVGSVWTARGQHGGRRPKTIGCARKQMHFSGVFDLGIHAAVTAVVVGCGNANRGGIAPARDRDRGTFPVTNETIPSSARACSRRNSPVAFHEWPRRLRSKA